jgi:hypothetical protein
MTEEETYSALLAISGCIEGNVSTNGDAMIILGALIEILLRKAPMDMREEWVASLCERLGLSLTPHQGMMH